MGTRHSPQLPGKSQAGIPGLENRETRGVKERVPLLGVVVGIGSQNPRPFGFAQGRLCRGKRDKDGAASGVAMSERVGQPPSVAEKATRTRRSRLLPG